MQDAGAYLTVVPPEAAELCECVEQCLVEVVAIRLRRVPRWCVLSEFVGAFACPVVRLWTREDEVGIDLNRAADRLGRTMLGGLGCD